MQKPSMCRIVVFHAVFNDFEEEHTTLPAIITSVNSDSSINIAVLNEYTEDTLFMKNVLHKGDRTKGSYWDWPERS
jgi:phosphoheptose isomerase